MIFNIISGHFYIGSCMNLDARLAHHLYEAQHANQLPLYRAFRKYGFESFSIIILNFCEPIVTTLTALEQVALDTYKPTYNILKQARSSTGLVHSAETIKYPHPLRGGTLWGRGASDLHSGENHPRFGVVPNDSQKKATSLAMKEYFAQHEHHNKGKKGVLAPQYGIGGKGAYFYGDDGSYEYFPSVNSARLFFKVRHMTISNNIDSGQKVWLQGK